MNDDIREQLSALVDDELSELERPLLVSRLEREAGLRDCLARYQLIGEVIRGGGSAATLGLGARVTAALREDDPLHGAVAARQARNWWKPVAGLAVAASVALIAVLSVTSLQQTAPAPQPLAAAGDKVPLVTTVSTTGGQQWDRIAPGVDKRLTGYLVNHTEYAASRGVQSAMPYARIVGFDNDER